MFLPIFSLLALHMSWCDIKSLSVPLYSIFLFFLTIISWHCLHHTLPELYSVLYISAVLCLIFFYSRLRKRAMFGEADYVCIFLISLMLKLSSVANFLIFSGIGCLISSIYFTYRYKSARFPMLPSIFAAFLIVHCSFMIINAFLRPMGTIVRL